MRVAEIINQKLTESLSPTLLEINDDSHKHAGHAGARPEGESHFSVTIVSKDFEGKSRILVVFMRLPCTQLLRVR